MSKSKSKTAVPITPIQALELRTARLSEVCNKVDSGIALTDAVKEEFSLALLSQERGVDEFLDDRAYLEARIEKLKQLKAAINEQQKKDKWMLEALEARAIELVDANPDLPFNGSLERLATAKNPPSVDLAVVTRDVTFTNSVSPEFIEMFELPEKYYERHIVVTVKLKEIADDLKANVELPWASLKQKKRLNPKPRA